jgi:hypothetical protein
MQESSDHVSLAARVVSHPAFDFQLLRQLGVSFYGGSTVGENLVAATKIGAPDIQAFIRHFSSLADLILADAEAALAGGHAVSAREAFLRASQHFQTAEYFARIANVDPAPFGLNSREMFLRAMPLMPWNGQAVDLPMGDHFLPCYFFTPPGRKRHRKTVLLIPGIESSGEEQFFCHAVSALLRGYNVFIFQGPGQAGMMRFFPEATMHRDLEVPMQIALDFLARHDEVDGRKLAVIGGGLGALFAARLTVADTRVKAVVLNPPYTDLHRAFKALMGPRASVVDTSLDHIDEIPDSVLAPQLKLFVINLSRRFGVDRLQTLLSEAKQYSVGDLLYRVSCPSLCITSEGALKERRNQAQECFDMITAKKKKLHVIPALYGPDHHDNVGNLSYLNQVVFDWLDDLF